MINAQPNWDKINEDKQHRINWGVAVKLAHAEMVARQLPVHGHEALLKKLIQDYYTIIEESSAEIFK